MSTTPTYTAEYEAQLRSDLVKGCKILHRSGMDTMAGHLSARLDENHILIKPRPVSWDRLEPEDLIVMDMNGQRVDDSGDRMAVLEWPLHTELYRLRPELGSVLHAHPRDSTLFGALGLKMEPLTRETTLFSERLPVHENPVCLFCMGNTVTTREMGREIAELVANNDALLLRYHGVLIGTGSIGETCSMAYDLELAAKTMLTATSIRPQPIMEPYKAEAILATHGPRRTAILKMMKSERWQKLQDYFLQPDEIGERAPRARMSESDQAATLQVLGIS